MSILSLTATPRPDYAPAFTHPLRKERRAQPRRRLQATRAIACVDTGDHTSRIHPLQLRDISRSGLGATASDPIAPGSRIKLFFPPHNPQHGYDLIGEVVRCNRTPQGRYDLGIVFDINRPAA